MLYQIFIAKDELGFNVSYSSYNSDQFSTSGRVTLYNGNLSFVIALVAKSNTIYIDRVRIQHDDIKVSKEDIPARLKQIPNDYASMEKVVKSAQRKCKKMNDLLMKKLKDV